VPVGCSVAFWSRLGHATILPSCGGGGFVQQRRLILNDNCIKSLTENPHGLFDVLPCLMRGVS
ncbi:hypothetical protein ACFFT9_21530, partial [Chromobacterium violaceum]|uniref:hypothetical protein n=1 Tax=Chromobacterium violaceum TaxID=536 RepID=UPI0035E4CB6A